MDFLNRLTTLVAETLGRPVVILGTEDAPVPDWGATPPTVQEQATFAELVTFARSGITGITFVEWQALRADINGLRTYQGLASPTLGQTVLAVKAQSRILRAIIRDE